MVWWHWLILAAANSPLYVALGWLAFASWDRFRRCLSYAVSPEAWGWLRGEETDWHAELAPAVWLAGCAAVVLGEGFLLQTWLGAS